MANVSQSKGCAMVEVFDDRACDLGEGVFWHPERGELFWFDILGKRLLSRTAEGPLAWEMDEHASAAGWIDRETLLIATETGLYRFGIGTGAKELIVALEADTPATRSNDGRADPMGGFWIGTMGKKAERGAGAIYRYYGGAVERVFPEISIPNAICFAPDGRRAYFADTSRPEIRTVALDAEGWPDGPSEMFIDLRSEGLNPDGAVTDAEGAVWNAQWGAGRVARYLPDGTFDRAVEVDGRHSSCPGFGGSGLETLYVTTALEGVADPQPGDGLTYAAAVGIQGRPEPRVKVPS
ncbi:SMP-30/gluconolactonase/LRE family protein [Pseudooceanicola sp. C21-150M6]|uniref:SMP-30/gluconolactonase/LRE family protein n=1 Tax=Pseudooceanicola sp. C21-150M6 TaxID=3434355 RepID=UPI003D7FBBC1